MKYLAKSEYKNAEIHICSI